MNRYFIRCPIEFIAELCLEFEFVNIHYDLDKKGCFLTLSDVQAFRLKMIYNCLEISTVE